MKKVSSLFLIGLFMGLMSCNNEYPDLKDGLYAEFDTNKGSFVTSLYYEKTPVTVANFVSLAEGTNPMVDSIYKGEHFYDSLTFHRVIEGFMIQGGDPLGLGSGGPGYKFPDEIVDSLTFESAGVLAMANAGPDTNGSQFFITLSSTPWLNGMHTIFGHVVKGQKVVDSIGSVKTAAADKPVEDVIIEKVNIIRVGGDAKDFNATKVFSDTMEKAAQEKALSEKKMKEAAKQAAANFAEIKPKAEKLPSGLMIYFNENKDGEKPNTGDTVSVYYAGYLSDGTLFDSNRIALAKESGIFNERRLEGGGYEPLTTTYGPKARLIAGFKEGLQQMSVGDVATFFIPAHLGYGKRGIGIIPPNADLIFKVELVEIKE